MPATYEPIASTTLGTSTSTITFSNISGNWTDLILIGNPLGPAGSPWIRFNSDSSALYSRTDLINVSGVSSRRFSGETELYVATADAGSSVFRVDIQSYSSTNVFKTVLGAAAAPASYVYRVVGLWRSTSAITSITIGSNGGAHTSGSTFSLYGIKAA